MKSFVLLADPARYNACSWDLVEDREAGQYWIAFFIRHFDTILKLAELHAVHRGQETDTVLRRVDACRAEFRAFFEQVLADPGKHQPLTIIGMDRWRDGFLRKHGFVDPFEDLKNRENEKMLPHLPAACARLDALDGRAQVQAMIEGVFAGNIFDMGAEATAGRFLANSPDFNAVIASLPRRPWLVDDFDALCTRLLEKPPKRTVFFIDNAGSDFLLGALPMIRWLARQGEVVLVANERPTLNDMTIHDVEHWWPRILATEPSLAGLPITRVSSGTGEPLIDLLEVSDALNTAAAGADLLILEGMGRGVESNFAAEFTCDALNIAMVKDHMVAKRMGGKVYDVVCRFRSGSPSFIALPDQHDDCCEVDPTLNLRAPFHFRVLAEESHIAALVERLLVLEPSDDEFDQDDDFGDDEEADRRYVIEVVIADRPREERLFLFRDGKQLGVRLAECNLDDRWWERRGFVRVEGESYIDPETYEEKVKHGEPVKFPVARSEAIELTLAVLRDYLQYPRSQVFFATDQGISDEWPEDPPFIVPVPGE